MNFLFEEVKVRFLKVSLMYMNLDSKEKYTLKSQKISGLWLKAMYK